MNLAQMDRAINEFKSPFETPGFMTMADGNIKANMTLSFSDNRQLYTYISQIHAMEPVVAGDIISFIPQDLAGVDIDTTWANFNHKSLVNGKYTLEFVANTLEQPPALKFIDKAQLGQANVYKPFGSTDSKVMTTHITTDVSGAGKFYSDNFKYKLFRGTVTFKRVEILAKGTVFDIQDRDIKIIIIEYKLDLKSGVSSYTGIVLAKGA